MPHDFQPDPRRKGRNKYVGSWTEPECHLIPLPFTPEALGQVLDWGAQPDAAPYTHQEIAHWCYRMHVQFLDTEQAPDMETAVRVATDVDCQWELFLANSYNLDQLRRLDFPSVRLPAQWFVGWRRQLDTEPGAAPNGGPGARFGNSGASEGPPSVS